MRQSEEIAERFPDLHPPFAAQAAIAEANRCLQLLRRALHGRLPHAHRRAALHREIARDNLRGSALTILDANVLGASCSRVCPVEVLCEGACVLHRYNKKPIEIARLQRFAMDSFHAAGREAAAQIAGGASREDCLHRRRPASLACAAELRQQGFQVTVFERPGRCRVD